MIMFDKTIPCSFCGKSNCFVITGPSVHICSSCVGLCVDLLSEHKDERFVKMLEVSDYLKNLLKEDKTSVGDMVKKKSLKNFFDWLCDDSIKYSGTDVWSYARRVRREVWGDK